MSNERTDEFLAWRGRLDQPDALPEQGLDNHEAGWQRLAERLREKPRRRLTGYWVAAACLLLALIPAVWPFHKRPAPMALRLSGQASHEVPASNIAFAPRPSPLHPPPAKTPAKAALPPASALVAEGLSQSTPVLPHIAGLSDPPSSIAGPAIPPAFDSPRLMAQTPAPGKPLRIVYFNEINHPATPSHNMAARDPAFLRISVGSAAGITINLTTQNH